MLAEVYNITAEQGAKYSLDITWRDDQGDPINLTGYTARMQVRESVSAADVLIELTTENGRITLGGAAGTILLEIDADVMAALDTNHLKVTWRYDLELVPADPDDTVRLLRGKFVVLPEVTRT